MGRTGKLFAHEWAGITPDIMALAKGLGGGFPIGACLATERAAQYMTPGSHGSTFGGNPLATSAANAVLDVMLAPGMLERVRSTAEILWARLRELVSKRPRVFETVRGQGLMIGLKCRPSNSDVVARLFDNGLLAVAAGDNVVRLVPPLIIGEAEVNAAIAILSKTAADLDRRG
jgi:acetylornithine/N-succinyldiaminopimelate aminotransferase